MNSQHPVVEGLSYDVRDGVGWVTITRAEKRNALTNDMYEGIRRAIVASELDPGVHLTVVTGEGQEWFCAGGDLVAGSRRVSVPDPVAWALELERGFPYPTWERTSKLVLAAINGVAQATGLIMALVADLTIACEDHARFRVPEALRGLADPYIPVRLSQHVGLAKARWMMYTAEEIDAREAERIGLIGKVVPHEQFETAIDDAVAAVKRTGPRARAQYKKMVRHAIGDVPLDEFIAALRDQDAAEGMTAFAEKRPPAWVTDPDGWLKASGLDRR